MSERPWRAATGVLEAARRPGSPAPSLAFGTAGPIVVRRASATLTVRPAYDPGFPCSTFSITNGRGRHQGDLPRLLRRMVDEIDRLGPDAMIVDFTVSDEVDDNGSFFMATVYYHLHGWADARTDETAD